MKNYLEKLEYLLKHQKHVCPVCNRWLSLGRNIVELHHKCHKAKWRSRSYPLFIDSLLNLVVLHKRCHTENRSCFKISDYNANKINNFLKKHPKIEKFVNNLTFDI